MNAIVLTLILLTASVDLSGADALFEEGKYVEAREAYTLLLEEAEEPADRSLLLVMVGRTWLFTGEIWEAEARFRESIEIEDSAPARLYLGQVYFYAGQNAAGDGAAMGAESQSLMNDAVRELARALELDPALAAAHEYLGYCERYRGNAAEEEAGYRRALELEPGRPGALLYLGYLLSGRGELEEARRTLSLVAPADRTTAHHLAMGRIAGLLKDEKEECAAYLKAVLSSPEDVVTYQALWDATGFKKKFAEFSVLMNEVIEAHPECALAHSFLGFSHRYAGHPEEAIKEFGRVLELTPDDHRARVLIAEILKDELKDDARARAQYLEVLEADPTNERARVVLTNFGFQAARDGDLDTAEKVFTALRVAEPTQWVHLANLGLILKERGRAEEALGIYEAAEAEFPFEPQIPNDRGLLLMGFGRDKEAFAAFQVALERDSEFLDALENLGAYSLLAGDAAGAVRYFRRAYDRVRGDGGDASKFRRYLDLAAREGK
jgi:tetratricopeptide (TPR) repeat protein